MTQIITSPSFFIGCTDEEVISFGSGQPDLPPPKEVYDILPHYQDFKYGLIKGQPNLRGALAKTYPNAASDQFIITNGASEALDLILRTIKTKKKTVLLPRPYYYSYPFIVRYAGLTPIYYDLKDGKIDLDNFKSKLSQTDIVFINSPSNPTGRVQDLDTLKEIESITQKKGIYVVSDEVYKDLIYERENYLIQGDRVITVNSFSKTYAMCGFRVGYLYSKNLDIINSVTEMKTHTSMNTNILGQEMAYTATLVPKETINLQLATWQQRRDLIVSGLKALGLDLWEPEGAFYVLPAIKNSGTVVNELYHEHNIITYDGSWFGAPDRIRFSYALDVEKITEGLSRLKKYLQK